MKILHIRFEGYTATFKIPFLISGVGLCSPVPSYSTLLGLVGCCAGRQVSTSETFIGFEYRYSGKGLDFETTKRLMLDKGNLKTNPEKAFAKREFHINPVLDLYITNLDFREYFEKPIGVPCLGRSQDIAWITSIAEKEVIPVEEGTIGPTLIPFPCDQFGGRILNFAESFENIDTGYTRTPMKLRIFQVVPPTGVKLKRLSLYAFADEREHAIYIHQWQ